MYSGLLEHKLRHSRYINVRRVAHRYALLRNFVFSKMAVVFSFLLKFLPVRLVAMIKERLDLYVRMPYSEKIIVKVDSQREIRRSGFCFREQETLEWLEQCAERGGTLYDVGANIGAVSLLYAANIISKHGNLPESSILSFEPLFSTYSKLCGNIVANGWGGGILPFSFPLSNKVKSDIFKIQSIASGSSSHSLLNSASENISYDLELPVITLTIDHMHYELNFPAPNFIKIDVDGHDYEVLLGAKKVFQDGHIKSVLIEMNQKASEIRAFMEQFNFVEKDIVREGKDNRNLRFDKE